MGFYGQHAVGDQRMLSRLEGSRSPSASFDNCFTFMTFTTPASLCSVAQVAITRVPGEQALPPLSAPMTKTGYPSGVRKAMVDEAKKVPKALKHGFTARTVQQRHRKWCMVGLRKIGAPKVGVLIQEGFQQAWK